jgi:hypothetical protein
LVGGSEAVLSGGANASLEGREQGGGVPGLQKWPDIGDITEKVAFFGKNTIKKVVLSVLRVTFGSRLKYLYSIHASPSKKWVVIGRVMRKK